MKTRLYLDVEFNGRKTDAESMATAMGKVVGNGLAVLLTLGTSTEASQKSASSLC